MTDYKTIPTSAEVWAVIQARHGRELHVFSSFTDPSGTFNGGPGKQGKVFTSYGFKDGDFPIMEAETTWEIDCEKPYERVNEQHKYWLCLPVRQED